MIRNFCCKSFSLFKNSKRFCTVVHQLRTPEIEGDEIEFDWQYLTDDQNVPLIRENIKNRKGVGDIDEVNKLFKRVAHLKPGTEEFSKTKQKLQLQAFDIPNRTHPDVPLGAEDQAETIANLGSRQEFTFKPKSITDLGRSNQRLLQTNDVAQFSGPRTYHLIGELAELESALVRYTFDYLMKQGFNLVSVPDFVPTKDVENSGFKTTGIRTQVYKLNDDICLAGTGEMSIASLLHNEILPSDILPSRLATVSRCYRAETADVEREKGLYRVHQFTKVEMFGVTADDTGEESSFLIEEFLNHQIKLFSGLNLHFRILNMPSHELGASAYRKYDIETWLPSKSFWGEISSTSNCLDYQARRLNIKYKSAEKMQFCHTVNGTACAVPRMLISILENNQQRDGSVVLPEALVPYMNNKEQINIKNKKRN